MIIVFNQPYSGGEVRLQEIAVDRLPPRGEQNIVSGLVAGAARTGENSQSILRSEGGEGFLSGAGASFEVAIVSSSTHMVWETGDPSPVCGAIINWLNFMFRRYSFHPGGKGVAFLRSAPRIRSGAFRQALHNPLRDSS